jgi:hypothetical protein
MLDVFRGLKGLVKAHRVTIDSSIFRLHYSATVTFLLAFSLIVTTRQGFRQHASTYSTNGSAQRVLNDIYRARLSRRRHTGRLRKRDNLFTGEGGKGWGWARSQIIGLPESLFFYISFNTLLFS